jgi:Domain of unknown function (DUF1857)
MRFARSRFVLHAGFVLRDCWVQHLSPGSRISSKCPVLALAGGFTQHAVRVNASKAVLWEKLLNKIRHPDKYIAGVTNVEIVKEHGELSVERKMQQGGRVVHEYITADPLTLTVVFKTAPDDPHYRGFVTNTVFEEDGQVYLDFTLNWMGKNPEAQDMQAQVETAIIGAVMHTKELAEAASA